MIRFRLATLFGRAPARAVRPAASPLRAPTLDVAPHAGHVTSGSQPTQTTSPAWPFTGYEMIEDTGYVQHNVYTPDFHHDWPSPAVDAPKPAARGPYTTRRDIAFGDEWPSPRF